MSIQQAELKWYKSATISDTISNGGRMSSIEATTGVKNNIFPDVSQAERTVGITRYRKMFCKVANDDDLSLLNARLFVEKGTPGEDRVVMHVGTQTGTQGDLTGSERLYGVGTLNADISVGAAACVVNTESTDVTFADGDLIRISNQDGVDDATGKEEWLRLASPGGVSWNGSQVTLTFDAGVVTANAFTAATTRVDSVYEVGTIGGTVTGWTETSGSGTYDEATYPVLIDSIGSVEETWTVTFTSATNYGVVGAITGSVGTGSIGGGDFAPDNSDFSKPYFTLQDAGFGGTWANGNTIVFTTHPAAAPFWLKQVVPAAAASLSANSVRFAVSGESA